ncbi:BNR repeat protein [Asanoa ferruginea]|uniref:BNR repeat protein n=1 Tax=Asanoa ferruginea TaxID=53367 RepID=A0A3D9ZQ09_9ACTN|nr:hypothetical protein [Asanoa ferruginea]REF99351.1 BNR repeat protein [Asanoa ferruginea]GIF45953.1 hypothetical protein Afe04nite_04920 [Asanoa ferruginea]
MRKATGVVAGAAIAVLAVVVGAAWLARDGATRGRPDRADGVGNWRAVHSAFAVDDDWMGGPQVLVADPDGCYAGFGRDGLSTGYWVGEGDCLRSTVVTPKRFTGGDSLPGEDRNSVLSAVPAHGGGYLAITKHTFHGDAYAYNTAILRGDGTPDGWRTVAQFDADKGEDPFASHVGPLSLAATETGYVAVGRHNDRTLAWLSTNGEQWRAVDLPTPPRARSTGVNSVAAAPDGRLVAIGTSAERDQHYTVVTWVSTDGGRKWRLATVPDLGGDPQLAVLLHDGHRFVALGGADGDIRGAALVLTSADGTAWQREDPDARMLTAATALPDGTVVAVGSTGEERDSDEAGGTRECAAAWLRSDAGTWTREELGCDGVPTSLVRLRDGRVAAVHWTTLFVRRAEA